MRKIAGLMLLILCVGLFSCGHTPNKEAMLKKIKEHPTELTQQDYNDILVLMEEELDNILKVVNDENTSLTQIAAIAEANADFKTFGETIGIAFQTDRLTPEQVEKLISLMSKSEQAISKGKRKIYEYGQ